MTSILTSLQCHTMFGANSVKWAGKSLLMSTRNNPCYTLPSHCQSCPHDIEELLTQKQISSYFVPEFYTSVLLRTRWKPRSNAVIIWVQELSPSNALMKQTHIFEKLFIDESLAVLPLLWTHVCMILLNESIKLKRVFNVF